MMRINAQSMMARVAHMRVLTNAPAMHSSRRAFTRASCTPVSIASGAPRQIHTGPTLCTHSFTRTSARTSTINGVSTIAIVSGMLASAAAVVLLTDTAAAQSSEAADNSVGRSLYAFGSNHCGALGLDGSSALVPTLVPFLAGVPLAQVVACGNVAGALSTDGDVYTWGAGMGRALGHDDKSNVPQPKIVEGLVGKRITQLAISDTHGAAVETLPNGETRVWMWGDRALGLPPPPPPPQPKTLRGSISNTLPGATATAFVSGAPFEVASLSRERIVSVACGKQHTLALTADGRVFAFGADRQGALGLGDADRLVSHTPTLIEGLSGHQIVAVSAGDGSSLFLTSRGEVLAAGSNEWGQAGVASNTRRFTTPTPVRSLRDIVGIASGAYHSLALDANGRVFAWGFNQQGALGLGHRQLEVRVPTIVPLPPSVTSTGGVARVSGGFETTSLLSRSGGLLMSGRGREGQMGRGDQTESVAAVRESPVDVTFFNTHHLTVVQAATGADFTLALVRETPQ